MVLIMGTLSNNSKIGDKGKDLILQTSGRVYIQVKDRFYEINFRDENKGIEEEKTDDFSSKIIIIESKDDISNITYPGDGYFIIAKDGNFFLTEEGNIVELSLTQQSTTTFSTPLTITSLEAPFIINSTNLVKNLNAEYLNGISSSNFIRKDTNENISKLTIKEIISNQIHDQNNKTILNLENGSLTIDTIRVNKLIVSETETDSEETESASESSIDIINKKTYFSNGITIKSISVIDKLESYIELSDFQYFSNENYLVGGYSIIDLIIKAFENSLLSEFENLIDYVNILTTCKKLNESNQWISYTPTEEDFQLDDNDTYPYKQYLFSPVDSSIYEQYKYGVDKTCLEGIYYRWYNIDNYTEEIKSKYQGLTFEIQTEKHSLNAGDTLVGSNNNGIIEALVVGCTEFTVRIIISGLDCYYENDTQIDVYEEWSEYIPTEDPSKTIYEEITSCLDSQNEEKGISISADPKVGDILFEGNSENIIGNIEGVSNYIFGTLSGYGISSEGNCYFTNPNIALTKEDGSAYLKLSNLSSSFIGGTENIPWMEISQDGNVFIRQLDMYDINTTGTCFFGPVTIYRDGSAIIGSRNTGITIDTLGNVTIPKSCIVE